MLDPKKLLYDLMGIAYQAMEKTDAYIIFDVNNKAFFISIYVKESGTLKEDETFDATFHVFYPEDEETSIWAQEDAEKAKEYLKKLVKNAKKKEAA